MWIDDAVIGNFMQTLPAGFVSSIKSACKSLKWNWNERIRLNNTTSITTIIIT